VTVTVFSAVMPSMILLIGFMFSCYGLTAICSWDLAITPLIPRPGAGV
jgi:hypothetical protein